MPRVTFGSFSIDAPSLWTLSTVILAGPVEDNPTSAGMLTTKAARPFQQNVIATMEQVPAGETPDSYVKRQVEGLRKAGVTRKETAKPEKVKLGSGDEGLLTEQMVVGPEGERVRQLQLVTIKDGVAHTIIASHLEGAPFDKARESFKTMLLSFR